MLDHWFLVANPFSNSGKAAKVVQKVAKELDRVGVEFKINLTSYPGEEIALVDKATSNGYSRILAVGGDGTAQKVVAGIILQKNIPRNKILFSLIPCGTGNAWAKSKQIPVDLSKNIKLLKNGKIKNQDVGVAKIINKKYERKRFFITYSDVGFDSFMLKEISKYKWLGKFSYTACALMNFTRYRNIPVNINSTKNQIEANIFLLGIGICKYTGGGMQLIKNPNGNDGLLNITIAQDFSKFDIIRSFFNLFNGAIFKERKVLTVTANSVKIVAKNGSLVCQGDGEIFGAGKIEYSVIKDGLRYLC